MSKELNRGSMDGVMSKGYGTIPKLVMQHEDLSIEAKAIYAYLASFAGAGDTAYPSVSIMCKHLGISKDRFYRHRKSLLDNDFIRITQHQNKGGWSNNLYTVVSMPSPQNKDTQNKDTQNKDTQNKDTQNKDTIINSSINNSSINNSINNNSIRNSPAEAELKNANVNKQLKEDFESLWKKHPNKKGSKKTSFKNYVKAIEGGTKHEEISKGLDNFIAYCQQNKWYTPAYASTWFNQERWENDYQTSQNKPLDLDNVFDEKDNSDQWARLEERKNASNR